MLSKQRAVTAVHTVDLVTSFVTTALRALFPLAFFVDSLERRRRTHFHHSAISFSIFLRASCTKMQAMRHRDASTSRRRVAGIRCKRSEYYVCEKHAREKNRSSRAEFSKILATIFAIASFNGCTNTVISEYRHHFYHKIFFIITPDIF